MRFNAKDFYATVLVAAIVAVYIAYLQDSSGWIISSTRATTAVVAVLGIGACAMGRVEDLYARDRSLSMAAVATWASMLGIIAVIAAVIALVTADTAALATLFAVTIALWVTASVRHALTAPGELTVGTVDLPESRDTATGAKAGSSRAGRPWAAAEAGDTVEGKRSATSARSPR